MNDIAWEVNAILEIHMKKFNDFLEEKHPEYLGESIDPNVSIAIPIAGLAIMMYLDAYLSGTAIDKTKIEQDIEDRVEEISTKSGRTNDEVKLQGQEILRNPASRKVIEKSVKQSGLIGNLMSLSLGERTHHEDTPILEGERWDKFKHNVKDVAKLVALSLAVSLSGATMEPEKPKPNPENAWTDSIEDFSKNVRDFSRIPQDIAKRFLRR